MTLSHRRRARHGGLASLEAVMATGITIPLATYMIVTGLRICRAYYQLLSTLVCWPYP